MEILAFLVSLAVALYFYPLGIIRALHPSSLVSRTDGVVALALGSFALACAVTIVLF